MGVAELLDRAVGLAARGFAGLAAIWAVYLIPLQICQFFGTQNLGAFYAALADAVAKNAQPGGSDALAKQLAALPPAFNGYTTAFVAVALLGAPLVRAAAAVAGAEFYLGGGVPSVGDAYRTGVRRWRSMLVLQFLWIGAALAAYVVVLLVGTCLVLLAAALSTVARDVGLATGIALGMFVAATLVALGAACVIAFEVGGFTVAVEGATATRAFAIALERVFARSWRRSLLAGLSLLAVQFGISLLAVAAGAVLYGFVKSEVPGVVVGAFGAFALCAFTTMFVASYYYDVRVRTEGFDVAVEAERARAAASLDTDVTVPAGWDDPLVRDLPQNERELVCRYAQRRAALAAEPRLALAHSIAVLVRPHLAASFDHLDDDALLMHVWESAPHGGQA